MGPPGCGPLPGRPHRRIGGLRPAGRHADQAARADAGASQHRCRHDHARRHRRRGGRLRRPARDAQRPRPGVPWRGRPLGLEREAARARAGVLRGRRLRDRADHLQQRLAGLAQAGARRGAGRFADRHRAGGGAVARATGQQRPTLAARRPAAVPDARGRWRRCAERPHRARGARRGWRRRQRRRRPADRRRQWWRHALLRHRAHRPGRTGFARHATHPPDGAGSPGVVAARARPRAGGVAAPASPSAQARSRSGCACAGHGDAKKASTMAASTSAIVAGFQRGE